MLAINHYEVVAQSSEELNLVGGIPVDDCPVNYLPFGQLYFGGGGLQAILLTLSGLLSPQRAQGTQRLGYKVWFLFVVCDESL